MGLWAPSSFSSVPKGFENSAVGFSEVLGWKTTGCFDTGLDGLAVYSFDMS